MSRKFLASAFACGLACATPLAAQSPQQAPPQQPAPTAKAETINAVSMEGCLVREVDVPGRRPPDAVQSRTATDNDFVLIDAKSASEADLGPTRTAPKTPQPDTPVGTSGSVTKSSAMYKVKDIDEAELQQLKGKRVRIEGTLDRTDREGNPATFAGDLVLLRGTSIKPVEGSCPR